jgi:hypothetical protein
VILTLRPEQVDLFWPMVGEGIAKAVEATGGDLTAGYLWQECRSGRAFLVISQEGARVECAWIFRFDTWASGVKLRCLAAWGENMDRWIEPMKAHVADMQRQGGANGVVSEGRDGWKRIFPKGRVIRTLFEVDLTDVG